MLHRAASALSLSLIGFALALHAASAIAQNRPGTSDPVSVDLVADAGFEQGVTGFEMRDGGDIQVSTSRPLVGRSSLQARFATGSSELWFESRLDTATQRVASVKASARIRNDASRNVDFSICASAYDSDWALVRACTPYHLTPGQTVEVSAALVFPAQQVLERAFLVIDNESQAALDLTLDEAHLIMVYQTIAGGTNPGPTDPLPNPDPNPAEDPLVNPGPLPAITAHPRLWITAQDLPRLRRWAHAGNPMFQALVQYAGSIKAEMIAGRIPSGDIGGATWVGDPSESYATLFAFLSLLEADPVQAKDWATRARTLLMHVMDRAAQGRHATLPFRQEDFATNDRGRWWGESFGLTVDWIYPYLSAADKATIRQVFLRWTRELIQESYHHPLPVNTLNNELLIRDRAQVRWANNNYFNAAMRNVGLMAMSLDPIDDPTGELRGRLHYAAGSWLYIVDHMQRTATRGGLLAEGFEYGPQSLAYQAQFLWALKTSGFDQPAFFGPQVKFENPFWKDVLPALLHSVSPGPVTLPEVGSVYQPSWFGAGQRFMLPDLIPALAPLAFKAMSEQDQTTLQAIRWIQTHMVPGGAAELIDRVRRPTSAMESILYFMLFDPQAHPASDPRPALPLAHFADGIGRTLARTDWTPNASWFSFGLSWAGIDHQTGDGLSFDFHRKGEWLTKRRIGYSEVDFAMSDNHNTLAVENARPDHDDQRRNEMWRRGSQDALGVENNPQVLARISRSEYVYVLGDATSLYNSEHEGTHDVSHVSRSVVFLKPDFVITYDRAETTVADRFKRFHLQLPATANIQGKRASMTSAKGQQLLISSLLPVQSTLQVARLGPELTGSAARYDDITHRFTVEAVGNPTQARFLHVLQGVDRGQTAAATTLIHSSSGQAMSGALIHNTVVLFPYNLIAINNVSYTVPVTTAHHLITGLKPGAFFTINRMVNGSSLNVTLQAGGTMQADAAGTLWF